MRKKPIIVGNWKMFGGLSQAANFLNELSMIDPGIGERADITLCLPFTVLHALVEQFNKTGILLGAQNGSCYREGALTSQISMSMIAEIGASSVLIGQPETLIEGSHCTIIAGNDGYHVCCRNRKTELALEAGLQPIIFVGETDNETNGDIRLNIQQQVRRALEGISAQEIGRGIMFVYEACPHRRSSVSPWEAADMCQAIREAVNEVADDAAFRVPILYGGSITTDNVSCYLKHEEIDGCCVGRASLDARAFTSIVAGAVEAKHACLMHLPNRPR